MVTHPVINPVQQDLTLVDRVEQVFPFGLSLTCNVVNVVKNFCWTVDPQPNGIL